MQKKSYVAPSGNTVTLEIDPNKWDLTVIMNILMSFSDSTLYIDDIDLSNKNSGGISKFRQRLKDIKMTRNKFSHSEELETREVYEQIDNIQRFFEMFKP